MQTFRLRNPSILSILFQIKQKMCAWLWFTICEEAIENCHRIFWESGDIHMQCIVNGGHARRRWAIYICISILCLAIASWFSIVCYRILLGRIYLKLFSSSECFVRCFNSWFWDSSNSFWILRETSVPTDMLHQITWDKYDDNQSFCFLFSAKTEPNWLNSFSYSSAALFRGLMIISFPINWDYWTKNDTSHRDFLFVLLRLQWPAG